MSQPDTEDAVMLGDTFMRNYYTAFHFGNSSVSMAPNKANCWATDDCAVTPDTPTTTSGLGIVVIICIAAGGFLLLLLLILVICKCCCKKENKDLEIAYDYSNVNVQTKTNLVTEEHA